MYAAHLYILRALVPTRGDCSRSLSEDEPSSLPASSPDAVVLPIAASVRGNVRALTPPPLLGGTARQVT